jgi:3-methyladenine DNA glycosylase/8-oxoguanine DNA glycosylase
MSTAENDVHLPEAALATLRRRDPGLALLIERVGPFKLQVGHPEGPLRALVHAIVFQQLSGKAAGTIYGRLREKFPPDRFPSAAELLTLSDETMRACGISSQKLGYLRDLCRRVDSGALELDRLSGLSDEEIIAQLTQVRGVGRWSAQMFLLFHLGRLDVWPDADLGIRSAVRILHDHDDLPSAQQMAEVGALYRPYASVASWYLWRLFDLPAEARDGLRVGSAW